MSNLITELMNSLLKNEPVEELFRQHLELAIYKKISKLFANRESLFVY